jgi:hypothetical protein
MRLSSALVEQTLAQFDAQVLPEDHPAVPQLCRVFGEHTFFVDNSGLNIVELTEDADEGAISARVIEIASWDDANMSSLRPHEPKPTGMLVLDLDTLH